MELEIVITFNGIFFTIMTPWQLIIALSYFIIFVLFFSLSKFTSHHSLPSWHLLVHIQQLKYQSNVWYQLKVKNKDTITEDFHCKKNGSFPLRISSVNVTKTAELVTLNEWILNGKLHFLCWLWKTILPTKFHIDIRFN